MNTDYFREFIILAETGNFQEAANRLYISQSTLSKHIKSMEAELNIPLFLRTTRKIELTKFGKIMLPYAQKIIDLQNEYSDILLSNLGEGHNEIRIGSIPALAQYGITEILACFKREHPSVKLHVVQATSDELKEMLLNKEIEIAFVRELAISKDHFSRIPYQSDSMVVVLPQTHPLAKEEAVILAALAEEEFIFLDPSSLPYELCLNACTTSGFQPKIIYTDHKVENIMDLVSKEMGIALLMNPLATFCPMPGIAIKDILSSPSTFINICFLKNHEHSIVARHFLQSIKT